MKTLTQNQTSFLSEFCDNEGLEFREDYSGRGMYGKTCIGFVGTFSEFELGMRLAAAIAEDDCLHDMDKIETELMNPATDSMGLDTIIYWTNLRMEEK